MRNELPNYLEKMQNFRICWRGGLLDFIRTTDEKKFRPMKKYYRQLKQKNQIKIKDLLTILNFVKRGYLLDEIFKQNYIFIQPRSKLEVKLPKIVTNDLAYLTGVIIGDGHVSKDGHQIVIAFGNDERLHIKTVQALVKKLFNKNVLIIPFSHGRSTGMFIESRIIHTFFTDVIGLKPGKKKEVNLPKTFETKKYFLHFLSGFFDTDGSIFVRKVDKFPKIKLSQKSKPILEQIQEILENFGIKSIFEYDKRTGVNYLVIRDKKSVFKFCSVIKSRHPRKLKIINEYKNAPVV